MPYQKGQSGNPGGRPKGIVAALKGKYGDDGQKLISKIADIIEDDDVDARTRMAGVTWLLERGWGKAIQGVELSGEINGTVNVHHHYATKAPARESK